ncbi:Septal ring factor EnvC, activator of murein hydrolases AmiA and AmiB [Halogranum rubrum]|uniref:Septal ring factor EnvC, activator of murein hydrolases AmiA and AmiB n=1 Tax=Halogranum rubrum TaxID=553466 RepID=A0A1I4C7Z3_9EURY|nr:peptidoglycan-binding protein [Halogranum rubrum]SFK76201.1 Septal ring factor EnvC, activator of murein hydrolases AmiA and AmiB [Halogranum rubrum]
MRQSPSRRTFLTAVGTAATTLAVPTLTSERAAASDGGDFAWPITGTITSTYYDTRDGGTRTHRGIDADRYTGDPIYAARAGTVSTASYTSGYGYRVVIDHESGYQSRYAHCQSDLKVSVGDTVEKHEHIADIGSSGGDYAAHVHFDIKRDGEYQYIPGEYYDSISHTDAIPKDFPGLSGSGGDGGTAYSWPTYADGDSGESVYSIQYLLEDHGYALDYHDGIYGSEVETAVEEFQASRGLAVDGVVGPNTWESLYVPVLSASEDPYWATYGAQHHLRDGEGYSISVDGYYGSETKSAVESFQSSAGLAVDGKVGHDTWQALVDI